MKTKRIRVGDFAFICGFAHNYNMGVLVKIVRFGFVLPKTDGFIDGSYWQVVSLGRPLLATNSNQYATLIAISEDCLSESFSPTLLIKD